MAYEYVGGLNEHIAKLLQNTDSKEDIILAFANAWGDVEDKHYGRKAHNVHIASRKLREVIKLFTVRFIFGSATRPMLDNPMFMAYGHGSSSQADNKNTSRYLNMHWKLLSTVGGAAIEAIPVVGAHYSTAKDTRSVGNSLAHLAVLQHMASKHRKTITISKWLDALSCIKARKAAGKSGKIIGEQILAPIPFGSQISGFAAKKFFESGKANETVTCAATAIDLHWRAFQEQKVASFVGVAGANAGPASRIVKQLFLLSGGRAAFGGSVVSIINEPCGWMAINAKLQTF